MQNPFIVVSKLEVKVTQIKLSHPEEQEEMRKMSKTETKKEIKVEQRRAR